MLWCNPLYYTLENYTLASYIVKCKTCIIILPVTYHQATRRGSMCAEFLPGSAAFDSCRLFRCFLVLAAFRFSGLCHFSGLSFFTFGFFETFRLFDFLFSFWICRLFGTCFGYGLFDCSLFLALSDFRFFDSACQSAGCCFRLFGLSIFYPHFAI